MTIQTKFSVFDYAWSIYGNLAIRGRVMGIDVGVYNVGVDSSIKEYTTYKVRVSDQIKPVTVREEMLFKTKEDLLKSL